MLIHNYMGAKKRTINYSGYNNVAGSGSDKSGGGRGLSPMGKGDKALCLNKHEPGFFCVSRHCRYRQ